MKYYTVIYNNSSAFSKYLIKQNTEDAAQKLGVKLKSKHTVVPHESWVLDADSVLAYLHSTGCAIEYTPWISHCRKLVFKCLMP